MLARVLVIKLSILIREEAFETFCVEKIIPWILFQTESNIFELSANLWCSVGKESIGIITIKKNEIMDSWILFGISDKIDDFCQLLVLSSSRPFDVLHFDDEPIVIYAKNHVRKFSLFGCG